LKDKYDNNSLYLIGVLFQIITIIIYYNRGINLKKLIEKFKLTFLFLLIFISNPALKLEILIYLPLAYMLALTVPLWVILRAAKNMILIIFLLVIIQGLFIGFEFYPGSEKILLLLWNPNVFWHYVTGFLILIILFDKKIPLFFLILYIIGCIFFGYSRGALIILMIATVYRFFSNSIIFIKLMSYLFIFIITLIGVFLVASSEDLFFVLIEYDDLLSKRISSAFRVGPDNYENNLEISDMPFIDIFTWGYWQIFLVSTFILTYVYRKTPQIIVLILSYLLVDSTVYSPLIISMILIISVNIHLLNTSKYKNSGLKV
jgi:hypothetical protein